MKILLLKNNKIRSFLLPEKVSGNFWITDFDINGNEKNIINVQANNNGEWELVSNSEYYCVNSNKRVDYVVFKEDNFYNIKEGFSDNSFLVYYSSVYQDMKFYSADTKMVNGITIGKTNDNQIIYNVPYVNDKHAIIQFDKEKCMLTDLNSNYGTYLNNEKIVEPIEIKYGDIIFIMGLKLIIIKSNNNFIIGFNNPLNQVKTYMKEVDMTPLESDERFEEAIEEKEMNLYKEEDYFHKKPRFIYSIKCLELTIDQPPSKSDRQDLPVILTVGPMLTMSLTSAVMVYQNVDKVMNGDSVWRDVIPQIIIASAMMVSMLLWPLITNIFNKRLDKKKEKLRQQKYGEYIQSKNNVIIDEIKNQEEILHKRYPSLSECMDVILKKQDRLWEKRVEDDDFFTVSIGTGSLPMEIDMKYPEDHFSMTEDILKDKLRTLEKANKNLNNVPIPYSFSENYVSAIIGEKKLCKNLIKNIILQLIAFHSYDNLKIVLFTNKENEKSWEDLKVLPHLWDNDKTIRFFASDNDEYKELTYNLERIFNSRKEELEKNRSEKNVYNPVYLIITDSFYSVRNFDLIKNIIDSKSNLGFSILIMNENISNLPDQCQTFVDVSMNESRVFKNIANNNSQIFKVDTLENMNINECIKTLANIPIEINDDSSEGAIPKKVGFLEMYDVGKIEQLNSLGRWDKNVPIFNMEAPVGFGKNGEKISLDLHEKFHGPHGLIAGMTGSGKSEFIITYILSMAVNYHPYEVQFILIDYKGGGLAGAFENKNLGIKLPHLVGVITNLEKNEINRSIASIESELKRRQALFNKAREISGESTVDIYKYQKMYREHIVDEPVSHLFIIADEFAELKTQQPEFMEQLISTARIGRSLGVHLILATQKPSGVVDSQIWSNTRFRVCLRVQEKSDSTEVIQCPDAAFLTQTGRFYLQVGFNEIFVLGQSAWAGGQYIPRESIAKSLDTSISFVNNVGYVIKNVETKEKREVVIEKKGEELINIVQYLSNIAKEENIYSKPLWLDKIPPFILITDLIKKYNYKKENYVLNPVIGEYDVPNKQQQLLLTIPFYEEGNVIIYGMAGSGKENFITSMIYSCLITYTPEEVNFYILDFGAEVLKCFNNCPIVGDIIYTNESEKVRNLFKMIQDTIEERKKLFSNYNGDFNTYCKNSGKGLPNIVIVINNYEAYSETYPDYSDLIIILTRDCVKYGVYFVFTSNTPDGIRFKLKQNFGQNFVLQQNSDDDYVAILGNTNKTYPSKIFGRGLIKKENVYEFQTAFAYEQDKISDSINKLSLAFKEKYQVCAKKVPVLPETVIYEEIENIKDNNDIVIGINKNDLEISYFNFNKNHINLISTLDFQLLEPFINPFILQYKYKKNFIPVIINAEDIELYDSIKQEFTYIDSNFDEIFSNLKNYLNDCLVKYKENNFDKSIFKNQKIYNCVIIGISSFKNKLSIENQSSFADLFNTASDLGVVNFIFVDSIDKIKLFEYEPWFKSNITNTEGIWVGNGIDDQFTINVTQRVPDTKKEIPYNFCFVVKRGKPTLVKFIEKIEKEEETIY